MTSSVAPAGPDAGRLTVDGDTIALTRARLVRAERLLRRFYHPQHQEIRYS